MFHAPHALAGVTSLRGEVLPVLDLAELLGAPAAARAPGHDARIVVVRERDGDRRRAGLLVDGLGRPARRAGDAGARAGDGGGGGAAAGGRRDPDAAAVFGGGGADGAGVAGDRALAGAETA